MTLRVEITPGLEHLLERQPAFIAGVAKATASVLQEAARAADPISSRFAGGLTMDVGTDNTGRLIGRVIANWEFSLFVEYGNAYQAPRPVLRQALDASQGKALRR